MPLMRTPLGGEIAGMGIAWSNLGRGAGDTRTIRCPPIWDAEEGHDATAREERGSPR
jgi:hypothetical protein